MEMLTCTRCKIKKEASVEFFPTHKGKKNGFDSWCRDCRGNYRSEIRRGNYRKFGYTDSFIKEIVSINKCVICGKSGPRLAVDHCHKTNTIRGLLCMNCNQGLGKFKDDPELLEFARIYLLSSTNSDEADAYLKSASSMEMLT